MTWFFSFVFVSFLSVTIVIIQQTSSVPSDDQIDQLRCPGNWSRFNYSCYSLSDIWSTAKQANNTCNIFHLNNSRLMYIEQPVELLYAAYVLTKNNLHKLVLEIDQNLVKDAKIVNMLSSNDDVQWDNFGKTILQDNFENNKENMQSSEYFSQKDRSYDDTTINRESTTVAGDHSNNDNKGHEKFKNVDHFRKPCQQIKWNVVNEDSNVLILTVELGSQESICSLSNADLRLAYPHLCQYVLDRCVNNIICGEHGRCVNSQSGFNCECSLLYDGLHCEKYSKQNIQIIFGIFIVVISIFLTCTPPGIILTNLYRQHPAIPAVPAPPEPEDDENNDTGSPTDDRIQWPPETPAPQDLPPEEDPREFKLKKEEQDLRNIFLRIFTVVFLLLVFKFPAIHHIKSPQLNDTNLCKVDSLINDNVDLIGQYRRYTILRIDNFIFLFVSCALVMIFSILNKLEIPDENDDRSGILVEPIKLLRITDRFSTTAIVVIQMFEILDILKETTIDIDESAQFGILVQILKRIFFVILIAFRYYPTLSSLQFQNFFVRLLIVAYFLGSMTYMTLYRSSGMHWLLVLMKILPSTQKSLYIDWLSWSFLPDFTRNILHYLLIGYICAELIMRVIYDSMYIGSKRGRTLCDIPHRAIDQYSFHADRKNKRFIRKSNDNATTGENNDAENGNLDQQGYLFRIREYASKIYKWDKCFRFTTIAICTYTVAYIFLFHLTGTVIILYKTQTNRYVRYTRHIFELILNIEVKECSFQGEVIISAILTMLIYGIQLFLSIKNYRKSMDDLYIKYSEEPKLIEKFKKREIIRKSTQYPSYLLLYLLGGFFICFHLILLISVIVKNVIFTQIGSSKGTIGYIIPILVLYLLQKMIIRWLHTIIDCFDQRKESDSNWKLNIFDSILLYLKLISASFIGVIASIIRLIVSVLVNIIFMPRIDYSYLVEPLHWLDSAHQSFESFIRLEMLCVSPILLDFSPSVQVVDRTGPLIIGETAGVEQQVENRHAENNENPPDDTSTSPGQSPPSQHRSLNRPYEPTPRNATAADNEDLTRALI